jgi:hypothetical protein
VPLNPPEINDLGRRLVGYYTNRKEKWDKNNLKRYRIIHFLFWLSSYKLQVTNSYEYYRLFRTSFFKLLLFFV